MSIFEYNYFGDPKEIADDTFCKHCKFCRTALKTAALRQKLSYSNNIFIEQAIINKQVSIAENFPDIDLSSRDEDSYISYCDTCGWWKLIVEVRTLINTHPAWNFHFGHSAILKSMNLMDINIPISEVSQYLVAKYEERFFVNPLRMEES